jgi:uncharacterized membrane protein YbhN (UPF0104 family)
VWRLAALCANAAIILAWAEFWRLLRPPTEAPVSYRRMFEISAIASALMNTVPFGGGHASSVVLLVRRADTTQRGALSVLALDQLGEGIVKAALFLLAAAFAPLPTWMRASVTTASIGVAAWLVIMLAASRWAQELAILKSVRALSALVFVALTKVAEGIAIAAVARAYGVDLSIGGTVLVLAATVLASMLPLSPGNLGTYEAGVFLAYRHLGLTSEQALGLALAQHACFMIPAVGIGYVLLSAQTFARRAIASR